MWRFLKPHLCGEGEKRCDTQGDSSWYSLQNDDEGGDGSPDRDHEGGAAPDGDDDGAAYAAADSSHDNDGGGGDAEKLN